MSSQQYQRIIQLQLENQNLQTSLEDTQRKLDAVMLENRSLKAGNEDYKRQREQDWSHMRYLERDNKDLERTIKLLREIIADYEQTEPAHA